MFDNELIEAIGLLVTAAAMIVCPIWAKQKNRNTVLWFFLGALLGGIGIVIIGCMDEK